MLAMKRLLEMMTTGEFREMYLDPDGYEFRCEEELTAAYDEISAEVAKYELRRQYELTEEQMNQAIKQFAASHAVPDGAAENVTPAKDTIAEDTAVIDEKDKDRLDLVKVASRCLTEEERVEERQRWGDSIGCASGTSSALQCCASMETICPPIVTAPVM